MRARSVVFASLLLLPALWLAPAHASGTARDGIVLGERGTPLVYTLFEPAGASASSPVPVILRTHGYGGSRETTPSTTAQALLDAGYAVITWDQRGFGQSGDTVQLDSPQWEVKDVSHILDYLATLPEIQKSAAGAPLAGMSGYSYAGALQLTTGAVEPRLLALAPEYTWHDLRYSLTPNGVIKSEWVNLFFADGLATSTEAGLAPGNPAGPQAGGYDTNLPTWYAEVTAAGQPVADVAHELQIRSPVAYTTTQPTLFIQGLPDSLFNANEAIAGYQQQLATGSATKLVLFCGGHSSCPYSDAGERAHLDALIVAWMDKYVRGAASTDTGPNVEWYDSSDALHTANAWPPTSLAATGSGAHTLVAAPVVMAGAAVVSASSAKPSQDPTGATSFRVPIAAPDGANLIGVPVATITLTDTTPHAAQPRTLFLRLVDTTTGAVVDGQTTPIAMNAGTTTLDLAGVGFVMPHGDALALEVGTNDLAFTASREPGAFSVSVSVSVPYI